MGTSYITRVKLTLKNGLGCINIHVETIFRGHFVELTPRTITTMAELGRIEHAIIERCFHFRFGKAKGLIGKWNSKKFDNAIGIFNSIESSQ